MSRPSFFLCDLSVSALTFSSFLFRPCSPKKTFALFRIHSHLSPIDAPRSSLHNAPTLQTGNRSSPDNRPRHLHKLNPMRSRATSSCAPKEVCVTVGEIKANILTPNAHRLHPRKAPPQ